MRLRLTARSARAARLGSATLVLLALTSHTALAQSRSTGGEPSLDPALVRLRTSLDRYRDPIVAVRDGYFSTVGCIAYSKGSEGTMPYAPGGMGVHFLNMALVGAPIDPAKPQVLIYEPRGDSLRLAAAEWFVPVAAAGGQRPSVSGHPLEGPMVGHEPLMPEGLHHYDLHVWLWKTNPLGVYAPTNPAVSCPKSGYSFAEHAPRMAMDGGH